MRRIVKQFSGFLAVVLLALPVWAGSHSDTAILEVDQPTMIGTAQLSPGTYQLQAKESGDTLQVLREGKVVATIPCHWTQLPKKAEASEVVTTKNQVTQVQFGGRTEAITFNR
jgi:hypothetical protein